MSTSIIPFTGRKGFFPFCTDQISGSSPSTGFSSVDLIEENGDAGLAHAIRLWWMLENLEFVPTGTIINRGGFTKRFKPINADQVDLTSNVVAGSICASGTSTLSNKMDTVEPAFRQCQTSLMQICDFVARYDYTDLKTYREIASVEFRLRFPLTKWVLDYYLDFQFSSLTSPTGYILIASPGVSSVSPVVTGTVDLFGLTLLWGADASHALSGVGLTATSTEWTF